MKNVSQIKKEWIEEVCSTFYENKTEEIVDKKLEKEIEYQNTRNEMTKMFAPLNNQNKKLKFFDNSNTEIEINENIDVENKQIKEM